MHGHVSKHVKMHKKPTGGTNKHGEHGITWSRKKEGYARSNPTSRDASQVVTPKQGLVGVGFNHITINSPKASNVVRPRTREANTSIKHRSKQA